jgi:hypothetical protein
MVTKLDAERGPPETVSLVSTADELHRFSNELSVTTSGLGSNRTFLESKWITDTTEAITGSPSNETLHTND